MQTAGYFILALDTCHVFHLKKKIADYLLGNPGKVRAAIASMMQTGAQFFVSDLYIFLRPKVKHRFIPGNIEFSNKVVMGIGWNYSYLQRPK